jgi:glycine cleavage system aminomethyltransferase T
MTTTAIRRTALFHAHQRAGAQFIEHHGWQVPGQFAGPQQEAEQLTKNAALFDLSWMTKLDVKGSGVAAPLVAGTGRLWELGRRHYLVTCEPEANENPEVQSIQQPISSTSGATQTIYVTDMTSVYAQFLLTGPRSRDLLRKLTSLNVFALENLRCGQASLAHVHSTVLRDDVRAIPAFHILVSREYGESVWEAILHAGHEFHLAPAGQQALNLIAGHA